MEHIGISDIALYVPENELDLKTLMKERVRWNPRLERHLERALRVTGQEKFRFPHPWEDTVTMAAEAAHGLLGTLSDEELAGIRYLTVGTESGVDHSKPVSAYVQGMLQKSGMAFPSSISSFQVQHACAGGTLALLSVAAMLSVNGRREKGVVIASDISRYETETTAEITQGSGAAALLVEKDPRLLSLDISTAGYCSQDVDDFFRPLGSETARVNGRYSMECYFDNLRNAFEDHAAKAGISPRELLEQTDYFVLHTPFANMPMEGMRHLLSRYMDLDPEQADLYMAKKGFFEGPEAIKKIGNTYTASLFMTLSFLLYREYASSGDQIRGKKVLLASYGSGNTMAVVSGVIAHDAPAVISSWDLDALLSRKREASWDDYQTWLNASAEPEKANAVLASVYPPKGNFCLASIRKDGYRDYMFIDQIERYRSSASISAQMSSKDDEQNRVAEERA
ncbi:MAG: hydroxymethylglutaryl-CoA synthase [Spirochaetales bacterium]|nr:hydroxymethylglutaryl-CoA synthase [Spirochaetales bacterium]